MKKFALITGLASVSIILIFAFYMIRAHYRVSIITQNRMKLSFSKVDKFKRSTVFLTYDTHLRYMDVSMDSSFHLGPVLDKNHILNYWLTPRPDGSRFYISLPSELIEFDGSANLSRRIPIEAFGFDPLKYQFWSVAAASNETLWLRLSKRLNHRAGSPTFHLFSIEWRHADEPNTHIVGQDLSEPPLNWPIYFAPWGSVVDFLKQGTLDSGAKKLLLDNWNEYEYQVADYHNKWGLLLSKNTSAKSSAAIIRIDNSTQTKTFLPRGASAVWGANGHIYFLRGSTQLWRCEPDGSGLQPVYLVTSKPVHKEGFIAELRISSGRTFIAYRYHLMRVPKWRALIRALDKGIVLIDLKNNEYRELPGPSHIATGMAWLPKAPR